jgi:hypothetical protein
MKKCDMAKRNERCQSLSAFGSQIHLHEAPTVTGNGRDRMWVVIKLPADRGWQLGRLQLGSRSGWIGFEVNAKKEGSHVERKRPRGVATARIEPARGRSDDDLLARRRRRASAGRRRHPLSQSRASLNNRGRVR